MRRKFAGRIAPDTRIDAVVAIKRPHASPTTQPHRVLDRYIARYGLTNTLGPTRFLAGQWLVLTEKRLLLFANRGGGFVPSAGKLQHALARTDVELQWADFTEATLHKRLIHLTTTDHRMNISHTILANSDEPDLLVRALGDRPRQIGLHQL